MLEAIPLPARPVLMRYALAFVLCLLVTAVALPLRNWLDAANTVMLFLLGVFISAVHLGRGPAILSAFLGVALFDVFFVPPHLSFTVADAQYLVTFTVMLAVGLITTHLTAQLAERREAAQARERETRQLYELARDLGAALLVGQATEILERFFGAMGMRVALLIDSAAPGQTALSVHGNLPLGPAEHEQAGTVYRENIPVSVTAGEEPAAGAQVFLPFSGATRVRGVLVVAPAQSRIRPLLDAVASLAGIAIERLHYAEVAQQSELDMQTETLRSSMLSSISHDLRTPLTSLVGLADSLADTQSALPAAIVETAAIIRDQAHAMHRMVTNLLEMARLQSGRVVLHCQWQPFDEIVGSSLRLLDDILGRRRLVIDLPADLPLVRFDAVPMERVLCNLLENAVKYSAENALISVQVRANGTTLNVAVCNAGSSFPPDRLEQVFDPFVRGLQEPAVPGMGIGLAICRAIVVAHGGRIVAANLPGTACVRFTLPLGNPPVLEGDLS